MLISRFVVVTSTGQLVVALFKGFLGVAPARVSRIQKNLISPHEEEKGRFQCLTVEQIGHFNDDYCDCPDGSDEPGTSACAGLEGMTQIDLLLDEDFLTNFDFPYITLPGFTEVVFTPPAALEIANASPNPGFYCAQVGFIPRYVPSWKVSDSVCDCCDGSDEWPLDTKCPNTCQEDHTRYKAWVESSKKKTAELRQLGLLATRDGLEKLREASDSLEALNEKTQALSLEIANLEDQLYEMARARDCTTDCVDKSKGSDSRSAGKVVQPESGLLKRVIDRVLKTFHSGNFSPNRTVADHPVGNVERELGVEEGDAQIKLATLKKTRRDVEDEMKEVGSALQNDLVSKLPGFFDLVKTDLSIAVGAPGIGPPNTTVTNWTLNLGLGTLIRQPHDGVAENIKFRGGATLMKIDHQWEKYHQLPSRFRDVLWHFVIGFEEGHICPEFPARRHSLAVYLACMEKDLLLLKEEPAPCQHVFMLGTPTVCSAWTSPLGQKNATSAAKRKRGSIDIGTSVRQKIEEIRSEL